MRRLLFVALLCTAGCGDAFGPDAAPRATAYRLESVGGAALPALRTDPVIPAPCTEAWIGGTLILSGSRGGEYERTERYRLTCPEWDPSVMNTTGVGDRGRWELDGDSITFVAEGIPAGFEAEGRLRYRGARDRRSLRVPGVYGTGAIRTYGRITSD